jgi:ABC-2 type transport system permease protein
VSPIYRLILRSQASTARLAALGSLGVLAIVIGAAIGVTEDVDFARLDHAVGLVNVYGLSLFVPVTTLVFASAALGEPQEDGTLVYLWLRPVARWRIALASLGATLTVSLPLVVVPMVVAVALTRTGADIVGATLLSTALATIAYAGVFLLLGLRVRRALVWGLAYILVWEGFVARAGKTASQLAIRAHARSVLGRLADGNPDLVTVSLVTGIAVPLVAAAVATWLTVRRLQNQDVA